MWLVWCLLLYAKDKHFWRRYIILSRGVRISMSRWWSSRALHYISAVILCSMNDYGSTCIHRDFYCSLAYCFDCMEIICFVHPTVPEWRIRPCTWVHTKRGRTDPSVRRATMAGTYQSWTCVKTVRSSFPYVLYKYLPLDLSHMGPQAHV